MSPPGKGNCASSGEHSVHSRSSGSGQKRRRKDHDENNEDRSDSEVCCDGVYIGAGMCLVILVELLICLVHVTIYICIYKFSRPLISILECMISSKTL